MSITVQDLMGRVAIAVRQDAPFAEIVAAMQRFAVSAVAVLDADRRPIGVVSEDDLLLKETGPTRRDERRKYAGRIAMELMSSPAVTATPGMSLRDAATIMHERRIRQLPVVDPVTGRMVGTLHRSDVLRAFNRQGTAVPSP